jgi:hypothetical protein
MKESNDSKLTDVIEGAILVVDGLLDKIEKLEAELEKKDNQIQSLVDLFYNKNQSKKE